MTTIGTKIRKLREIKGFKQEQIAYELGITAGAYSKIERDETDITHERLVKVSEILGLKLIDLLSFDEAGMMNYITNSAQQHNLSQQHINEKDTTNNYSNFPEEVKKLYDDRNKLQEEKNKLLEEKIVFLQGEIERLKGG